MIPDLDLVEKVKATGDESALCELVNRHSGIYYQTVKKYAPYGRIDDTFDDFYRRKEAEVFKAVQSFDSNRGVKFSSWLANQTRFSCLTARDKQKEEGEIIEYDESFGEATDITPETIFLQKEKVQEVLSFLKEHCSERICRIFEMKFFGNEGKGMKLNQIAKVEGISNQAAQQAFALALSKAQQKFA